MPLPAPTRLLAPLLRHSLSTLALPALRAKAEALFAPSPRCVFLVGGPGAGKGSIISHAASSGWRTVSVGDLLRAAAVRDADIAATLRGGGVVPGTVSASEVLAWMEGVGGGAWLIDGFPRSVESAEVWEEIGGRVEACVDVIVDEDVMRRRLGGRGREDDGEVVVAKRLAKHAEEAPGIRRFYEERGLYSAVNGDAEVEAVWRNVRAIIGVCPPP